MREVLFGRRTVIVASFAILGIVVIVATLLIVSPYLSIIIGPFESSMVTATLIASPNHWFSMGYSYPVPEIRLD